MFISTTQTLYETNTTRLLATDGNLNYYSINPQHVPPDAKEVTEADIQTISSPQTKSNIQLKLNDLTETVADILGGAYDTIL